jgi:hypothetical protein
MSSTAQQYAKALSACREIFEKKNQDYGTSWRVLRTISIVDQLFIKAKRIRTIQEQKIQKVQQIGDDIPSEFKGIVNYAIMGLIQLQIEDAEALDLEMSEALKLYDLAADRARVLMQDKNHDYGEAWRDMSEESFVDLMLVKLRRIKQILQNEGQTLVSEGIESNLLDIINYAIFALILRRESA